LLFEQNKIDKELTKIPEQKFTEENAWLQIWINYLKMLLLILIKYSFLKILNGNEYLIFSFREF
jgi:hypothetical protein